MKVHLREMLDVILFLSVIDVMERPEEKITNLRLESVTISRGSKTFEFSGIKEKEYYRYYLGTIFEVCFDSADLFKRDIIDDESTVGIWGCLEADLQDITLSKDGRVCELKLDNSKSIFIWSLEVAHDNLLVARRHESDEWFTIG